jgi:hypothetical protein
MPRPKSAHDKERGRRAGGTCLQQLDTVDDEILAEQWRYRGGFDRLPDGAQII